MFIKKPLDHIRFQIIIHKRLIIIKNIIHHSDAQDSESYFGVFLSSDTAVVGCCDGGSYFKNADVRRAWESKERIVSREDSPGLNLGTSCIYHTTDSIFIDDKTGTFFGKFDPRIYLLPCDKMQEVFRQRSTR